MRLAGRNASRRAGSARRPAALAVLLAVLALSACLAPGAPDPTGTAPIGNLERVTAQGDGIRLQGWVADPDTPDPITISVSSEQKLRRAVADLPRPDVAAAYPGLGPNHGFDFRYPGVAIFSRRTPCSYG